MASLPNEVHHHPRLIRTLRVWLFITMSLPHFLNVCGGLLELFWERHQNDVERSTNMVDGYLEMLLFSTIDQETGLRRYITTADPDFLAPFYQGYRVYQVTLPHLTKILQEEEFKNARNVFIQFDLLDKKWYNSFALKQIQLINK